MNSAELEFPSRHIGPSERDIAEMLSVVGVSSLEQLAQNTVPSSITSGHELSLQPSCTETEALAELRTISKKNKLFHSYIGLGYSDTITPAVIRRNILENPGWYTQYTPYQAEISQGRLEALLNFQTMVSDLTGLPLANASLLDEGTAAAEAMTFAYRVHPAASSRNTTASRSKFFVSERCHPQTLEVVQTRARPLGIEVVIGDVTNVLFDQTFFGALVQYPTSDGEILDYSGVANAIHAAGGLLVAAADILSLVLLKPPGEWDADVVVGNSQRFGVPLGFGGPHAAFFATRYEFSRDVPGRVVGVSKDSSGRTAYRLAIQTREQHIKRERATSNICTAQVLLAVMAGMYGVYHGPDGLRRIAGRVHRIAAALARELNALGFATKASAFFDTIRVECRDQSAIRRRALSAEINLRYFPDGSVGVSLDETTTLEDATKILSVFSGESVKTASGSSLQAVSIAGEELPLIPKAFQRTSKILTHPVFHSHRSETELLRYIHRLQSKDLSLTASMIPLGSCTMKLNAAAEMEPVSWPEFAGIHPFAPVDQVTGYHELMRGLEDQLAEITGMAAVSLQPNAGSQGEYAGLLVVRAYHAQRNEGHRDICLIPSSAHGTNPATAAMAGMQVVTVRCDTQGNVDLGDLQLKVREHSSRLAAIMVTYPSTHGVFEEGIVELCKIVHEAGGQVYMDGANLNAQVGLCRPGDFGVDLCHLNLHKTFCIPHGGGGPGVGPIAVKAHLAPHLPQSLPSGAPREGKENAGSINSHHVGAVASVPQGSAGILVIPWMYIRMMGAAGLRRATQVAILNANYIAKRLEGHFDVLYRGAKGYVAHECILDLRQFKRSVGVEVQDVAKRLMDYGFHAPTVSFPVIETLMVEPTESESKRELDRFCDALIAIREEIREVELGKAPKENNVLKHAPHTAESIAATDWTRSYSREKAAFPVESLREFKFWPAVGRIDSAYGDRNLFCSCAPVED